MKFVLTLLPSVVLAFFCQSCSTGSGLLLDTSRYPVTGVTEKTFKKGQPTSDDSIFPDTAEQEFVRIAGQWKPAGAAKDRSWNVGLYQSASARTVKAIREANDGYKAGLGSGTNSSARIYLRFERKKFKWGEAVTFLVQYQNDNTNYVPNNGMLIYEVHGLAKDGRYLKASFGVTHSGLAEFGPDVRDHRDADPADPGSAMRRDPSYRLVESTPAESFEPSLNEIDHLLDTLNLSQH